MKIVLAGSPKIAVDAFKEIIKNFEVVAVVTQPDRPKGRGMKLQETDVSALARESNIKVFKPERISEIYEELKALDFDLFLTFAYGQFIPQRILDLGNFPPLNIHGSLLPKYRGAAPIHYAIMNGDKEIGITLIEMTKEMDAGDMYFQEKELITPETTTGDGFKIISKLATKSIVKWLHEVENKRVKPAPQPLNFTLSPKIPKEMGLLRKELSTDEAMRIIRGLNPFPGAFTFKQGKRLKVFNAVMAHKDNAVELKFKDGTLYAIEYQWEGGRKTIL